MTDELKQSLVDIVHHELWSTITLPATCLVLFGICLVFALKNWFLNWVQNKVSYEFNQKLEAYKSDLQGKLESYKNGLQADLEVFRLATTQAQDRRARSNEKEYDACIECWKHINDSYLLVWQLVCGFRPAIPVQHLNEHEFNKFSDDYNIPEIERKYIFQSPDRNKEFLKSIQYQDLFKTKIEIDKAKKIISEKGIFIQEDLYISLVKFMGFLTSTWSENYSIFSSNYLHSHPYSAEFVKNGQKKIDSIRDILRENLHIRAMEFTHPSQRDTLNPTHKAQSASSNNSPVTAQTELTSE
ncbi:hypothetical protein [Acetobacter pasteurianus]|uniref:hypothetical protein n=1 Tax=Acetobacter pasteurianus TaxID=438 RepID=UPI003D0DF8E6